MPAPEEKYPEVTFRPLAGKAFRCNHCGKRLKQGQLHSHRNLHLGRRVGARSSPRVRIITRTVEVRSRYYPYEVTGTKEQQVFVCPSCRADNPVYRTGAATCQKCKKKVEVIEA